MKLRIKGNSVRLRVTQSEVESLKAGNSIVEHTNFVGSTLNYELLTSDRCAAQFENQKISVFLDDQVLQKWFKPEEVSIRFKTGKTQFLIEKDFACLITREGEDDIDAFPNPLAKAQ